MTPKEAWERIKQHMEGCNRPECLVCKQNREAVAIIEKELKWNQK